MRWDLLNAPTMRQNRKLEQKKIWINVMVMKINTLFILRKFLEKCLSVISIYTRTKNYFSCSLLLKMHQSQNSMVLSFIFHCVPLLHTSHPLFFKFHHVFWNCWQGGAVRASSSPMAPKTKDKWFCVSLRICANECVWFNGNVYMSGGFKFLLWYATISLAFSQIPA